MILDFEDTPGKRPAASWARYVLSAGLLIASGFFATALLVKPAIQHNQVAGTTRPQENVDSVANPSQSAASPDQPQPDSTVIRNGVTVVTPHLLVPVVSDAAAAATEQSAELSKKTIKPAVPKARTARRSPRTGPLGAPWFNPTKQVVRY